MRKLWPAEVQVVNDSYPVDPIPDGTTPGHHFKPVLFYLESVFTFPLRAIS